MRTNSSTGPLQNHIVLVALGTASVLLTPLIAMRLTSEVNWTPADFIAAGALLFGTGFLIQLAMTKVPNRKHRVAIAVAIIVAFLYVWVELAVGLFTSLGS